MSNQNYCTDCGEKLGYIIESPNVQNTDGENIALENKPIENSEEKTGEDSKKSSGYVVGIIIIVAILILWYINKPVKHISTRQFYGQDLSGMKAYLMSEEFVKEKLNQPLSAAFPTNYKSVEVYNDSTYFVSSYVDVVSANSQTIRISYDVQLKFLGGLSANIENWKLLGIKFSKDLELSNDRSKE